MGISRISVYIIQPLRTTDVKLFNSSYRSTGVTESNLVYHSDFPTDHKLVLVSL